MECVKIDYSDLSQDIHGYAMKNRIPISGGLELTWGCNLRCVHCYIAHQSEIKSQQEISFNEIKNILDQLATEGCLWLLITGGEPLIRNDFLDIYVYAKKRGFIVTLFTNVTLLNENIIECFKKLPPFNIEITFYGATAETHELITQVPGSFNRFLLGIDLLLKNQIPFRLKSILMTLNKHEIHEMKKMSENYGTSPFLYDPILSPRLDGTQEPCSYRLSPDEIVDLEREDPELLANWQEFIEKSIKYDKLLYNQYLYNCCAGKTSFFIDPYNNLNLCVLCRFPNISLRKTTFKRGWNFLGELIKKTVNKNYKCKSCKLVPLCGQCPGWSQLEYGQNNDDACVDYLCEIANRRFKAFTK